MISFLCEITLAAQAGKAPGKLLFPSKAGDVTFDHGAHLKREKGVCTACHDKLWPQSAKEPLRSSAGCKDCHRAEGKSFDMKGNCAKCHQSKAALNGVTPTERTTADQLRVAPGSLQ